MLETPAELDSLQRLLDQSMAHAGPHLRGIITGDRRLTAGQLCETLRGMRLLVVATVTADGRPLAGPVDGYFLHGTFCFSSGRDSVRMRHLAARPAVSATHLPGDQLAVILFVTAVPAAALVVPAPGTSPVARGTLVTAALPAAGGTLAAPRVRLRGAELVDASTGTMLWGKDISVPRPMGSITKVMTALLVLRAGDLGRKIKVTRGAVRYVHSDGASSAGLIAGDVLTARELLKAMLIPSGCDAAYLLAGSYGPGRRAFVGKMNEAAR